MGNSALLAAGSKHAGKKRIAKGLAPISPTPPAFDTADRDAWWDRIVVVAGEAGLLRITDEAFLDLLCRTLARMAQLDTVCEQQGVIIQDDDGRPSEAPWYKAYCTERVQVQKLFAAGGFSPDARKKIMGQSLPDTEAPKFSLTQGVTRAAAR